MGGQLRIVLPEEVAELVLELPGFDYTREKHERLFWFSPPIVPVDEPDDEGVFNDLLAQSDLSMRFRDASGFGKAMERMEKGALARRPSPTVDDIRLKVLTEHDGRAMPD